MEQRKRAGLRDLEYRTPVGGARVQVDANVNEAALKRVLLALKATT